MSRIAGALLSGAALLMLVLSRLGHEWLSVLNRKSGAYIVPTMATYIPWYDWLILYGALVTGFWLLLRRE